MYQGHRYTPLTGAAHAAAGGGASRRIATGRMTSMDRRRTDSRHADRQSSTLNQRRGNDHRSTSPLTGTRQRSTNPLA